MELSEGKVFVVCIGLQVFPNVRLCVNHTPTSRNRGKELSVNDLSRRLTADIRFPLVCMVASKVISANFKLVPFVIKIK